MRVGQNKKGTVRYCGRTHFSEGVMVGVSLDSPHGNNLKVTPVLTVMVKHGHDAMSWHEHGVSYFQ